MYFTNIGNRELLQFHEQVKVNFNTTLQDGINNPLFIVQSTDSLIQVYPLFYTDSIESSNSLDRVLGDKCIICEDNQNTTLFFVSNEGIPVLSLDYSYYTDNDSYYVFYLYDGETGNSLSGVTAAAVFKNNDMKVSEMDLVSNKKGIIYIDTNNISFDEIEINFSITDVSESFTWSE